MSDLAGRVARGAALLDTRRPGWRELVPTDERLDMVFAGPIDPGGEYPCGCVLAWVYGNYEAGLDALGLDLEVWDLGFEADYKGGYPALTEAWRRELAR